MTQLKATCRDCGTAMLGNNIPEISDLMIAHHRQGRLNGSWTSGACGIFFVEELNKEGKPVKGEWVESTMNVIVKPWTGEILYDPRRSRGKER